jgi:hypothetical protein
MGEPRLIPADAVIHHSVIERKAKVPSYQPVNLPALYTVEQGPNPPVPASATDKNTSIAPDDAPA